MFCAKLLLHASAVILITLGQRSGEGRKPMPRGPGKSAQNHSDTEFIQSRIDSGEKTVVIPFIDRPWHVHPIRLRSNLTVMLEPGVELLAAKGSCKKNTDSLFIGHEVNNVTIVGYGATLTMRKSDYSKPGYEIGEWRHGIDLRGSRNIRIEGLTIQETGGDGVYIGPTWDDRRVPCEGITVLNCKMRRNHRQGLTVVSGIGVTIGNCEFNGTSGTNPQAGIDLEPSNFRDRLSDIKILNCELNNNVGSAFLVALPRLTERSAPVEVLIENCSARGSRSHLVQSSIGASAPRGVVRFVGCTFRETPYAGLRAIWKSTPSQFEIRFENCKWSNLASRYKRGPISLDLPAVKNYSLGGFHFKDSVVFDDGNRSVISIEGAKKSDISGNLKVIGATPSSTNPNLEFDLSIEYCRDLDACGGVDSGRP